MKAHPMRLPLLLLTATSLSALNLPLWAADAPSDPRTVVNLSAEVRQSAPQDRLQATLSIEAQGNTAAAVQSKINAKMQDARALYQKATSVKVTSGGYNVWKQYPPEDPAKPLSATAREAKAFWTGSQQLVLDGTDAAELLKLVTPLQQQGFAVQSLNYYLSQTATEQLRDSLLEQGLATLRQRAERIAKALNLSGVQFTRVDLNTGSNVHPMLRSTTMSTNGGTMPEAVVQAGETDVLLTISAEVKLGPAK
jgi:predicted secreted protein